MHHAGLEALKQIAGTDSGPIVTVAAASAAVGDFYCSRAKGVALERLRLLAGAFWGFSSDDVTAFIDELEPKIQQTASMFALDVDALPSAGDLIAEANEQLALLAVTAQAETVQARARQQAAEQEIQSLECRQKELLEQTVRDGLTKVFNRRYFDETLKIEVKQCMRDATALGLIFLDVDRFKQLNDSYGHAVGDEVLVSVAARIGQAVRGGDVIARYGGEEFVVLVKHPTEVGLERLAERIRAAVADAPVDLGNRSLPVTISVGAALMIPARGQSDPGAVLVEAADQAMYEAKRSGRNCVRTRSVLSEFDRELLRIANRRRFSRWLVNNGGFTMLDVSKALVACRVNRVRIGELACRTGLLDEGAVAQTLEEQLASGLRFGETAVRSGLLTVELVGTLLALQQEDPQELANQLVAQNLCSQPSIQKLLDAYFNEVVARPTEHLVDA
jgi:diguanylate cyclase (GGDEF)-like protein